MGISLALCQIDHENVVVRGLPLVNLVLRSGDTEPLRELLRSMPFDEDAELVAAIRRKIAILRNMSAPALIIGGVEDRLRRALPPSAEEIESATLDRLRDLLGRWSCETRTLDCDKESDWVHWYCDPARRNRGVEDWRYAEVSPSVFDFAFHGAEAYPQDDSGQPVIRTAGMQDSSWYNPPAVVAQVAAAFARFGKTDFDEWAAFDARMWGRIGGPPPEPREDSPVRMVALFRDMAEFYTRAAARGFGVSVEYY